MRCFIKSMLLLLVLGAITLNPAAFGRTTRMGKILFEDDFSGFRSGPISTPVGAHTEYHYLPEAGLKGAWYLSTFTSDPATQRAWRAVRDRGASEMAQTEVNRRKHTHPMLVTGNDLWQDYTVTVLFSPQSAQGQSGVVFRYRNDRCYYFFGVDGARAVLKMVQHATAFRQPHEKILAETPYAWTGGEYLTAEITVEGDHIGARMGTGVMLEAEDSTYPSGGIGLTSDVPARFRSVKVTTTYKENRRIDKQLEERKAMEQGLLSQNPKPVVWKKIRTGGVLPNGKKTNGFGVGRNVRFGDLNGDGEIDILFGQVLHHGPKDRNSEVGCMTAMTFDGEILWQIGTPDPWRDQLTNDVGFQIHDLDGDGTNEVVYCKDFELVVADGATGETKYKTDMPETPENTAPPYNRFPRILGDSLYFCDLRGTGHPKDIIVKNRYQHFWALNENLELMWRGECVTGHYPFAFDIDGDGKDELSIGYSLFDDDGKKLWSLDGTIQDHADGVAIANFNPDGTGELRLLCAASDEGIFFTDMKGNILKHHYLGHVQNPAIANFRDDLPGLEAVSINFWGNQGIVHYFDSSGDVYHDFEPCQHGSMCLPINWTGRSEEYFVLSANVEEGGLFDGWGRRVVQFPADGHPDMCNAVLDITGDCRDEIVVWDPYEVWVYTQDDNPKEGPLHHPKRNSLSNYSNYQATVSLPE